MLVSPFGTPFSSFECASPRPHTIALEGYGSTPRTSFRSVKALFADAGRDSLTAPPILHRKHSPVAPSTSVNRQLPFTLETESDPQATMSRRNSYEEETFSSANSFDEIGDEIADERTHDFDEVDSLDDAVDRYASKPLSMRSGDEDIMSDLEPSDGTDSQKGTYHALSTTAPRPAPPGTAPPPPPPPPRALGTITSTAISQSEQPTDDEDDDETTGYTSQEDTTLEADITERDVTQTTDDLTTERPRAVSYRNTETGTTFTFGASPFAGVTTPSGRYHSNRFSGKNVNDALVSIWDRFWSDDMRKIARIIQNRFKELVPHIRRFLAHLVAFWGGVTYIRRALSAFIRLLQRDSRVRELLQRLGWASSTTLRVFMSLCAMVLQASLQMYFLMRDRIIPQLRRIIPKCYYKTIVLLLRTARHSPWSLALGPFSLTAAIESRKIPDPYLLHNKFGVPESDTSFDFGTAETFTAASSFFSRGRRTAPKNDEGTTLRESTFRDQPTISSNERTIGKSSDLTVSGYGVPSAGKENYGDYNDFRDEVSSVDYKDF